MRQDSHNNLWFKIAMFSLSIVSTRCHGIEPSDIALYSDNGCWEHSVQALEQMFHWMGYTVAIVDAEYINQHGLDDFHIVCIPGGDMYTYAQDLSSQGKEYIRDFVRKGGGYIGICGGAYFASAQVIWRGQQLSMTSLAIFQGTAQGPYDSIVPYPDYGMCTVNIVDSIHPITRLEPDTLRIMYYWGPALKPNGNQTVAILGKYDAVNEPAMVAFEYEQGRVFLIGTHPEIEEDSERDGTTFGDELDDNGSDWELMKKAAQWCVGEQMACSAKIPRRSTYHVHTRNSHDAGHSVMLLGPAPASFGTSERE